LSHSVYLLLYTVMSIYRETSYFASGVLARQIVYLHLFHEERDNAMNTCFYLERNLDT